MSFDNLLSLSVVILILPLISFILIIFNQKRLGRAAGWLGFSFLIADLIMSAIIAYNKLFVHQNEGMIQWKFDWFSLGTSTVKIGIGIDNLTAIMLIVVTLISSLVHLFSTEYMRDDSRYPRFYAYLGLFTFSMLGIVLANNFMNMYIFWELVGISSYLLIGFWYEKDSAANANKKAFITNRVGDLGMLIGILICFFSFGTFMFDEIFAEIGGGNLPFNSETILTVAGICLFMGAVGKSAQFPLHIWLPDAMEGPTPVSALIHAATMVAAGVYLTARIFPMLSADALVFVAYIGAITAFLAATIAITQNDFKRVLAYSTVSQLGYMIMGIGVGAWSLGFMHLVTHAWFKACLFLASGSVIHAMHHSMHHQNDHHTDPQDIRNMGGLRNTMPITYYCFLFACIAIAGVPFTSGFLSKDGILAGTLAFGNLSGHWFIAIAGFSAAFMTAFYMFRLCIEAFHGKPKTEISAHTHENKAVIVFPLILLAGLSFWFFYSGNPFDANSGWFINRVQTPASVVPAEYQFDFITSNSNHHSSQEYQYPRHAFGIENMEGLDGKFIRLDGGDEGKVFVLDTKFHTKRAATPEEVKKLVDYFNKEKALKLTIPLTVAENSKIILDNDYNKTAKNQEYQYPTLAFGTDGIDGLERTLFVFIDGNNSEPEKIGKAFISNSHDFDNPTRAATLEETQKFVDFLNKNEYYKEVELLTVNKYGEVVVDNAHNRALENSTVGGNNELLAENSNLTAKNNLATHEHHTLNKFEEESHHQHIPAMILSLVIAGCGILLAFVTYQWKKINADKVANAIKPLYNLSFNKWYIDEIYEKSFIGGTVLLSKFLSWFDNKIVDGLVNFSATVMRFCSFIIGKFDNLVVDGGVNFTAWTVGAFGRLGRKMQTGSIQTYLAFSIIILMVIAYFVV